MDRSMDYCTRNYPHGLTYVCELRGRRVRYVTAHVSRMKLFHARPDDLDTKVTYEPTDESDRDEIDISDVEQRRLTNEGEWEYLAKGQWFSEDELIKEHHLMPTELDSFHALYELKHTDD